MKKIYFAIAALAVMAAACQPEEKKGEVLSPDESKVTLDETLTKAVEMVDVENWQSTAALITDAEAVSQNLETDETVYTWLSTVMQSFNSEQDGISIITYDASKAKGAFTIADNKLSVAESDALTLSATLPSGTVCDADVKIADKGTKVLVETDYATDEAGNETEEVTGKVYVIVPTSVDATVNAAGQKALGVNLTTKLNLAGEAPTPTDTYEATAKVTSGSYTLAVTRAKYSPTEIVVNSEFKYGKTTVFAASLSAKGNVVFTDGEPDLAKTSGKVNTSIKILNDVELKGDADWTKLSQYVGTPIDTEENAKAIVAVLEECVNLTLYIQKTAQAKLGFEVVVEPGSTDWNILPVIRFEDGSAYQLPEEFFSEDGFPKTIEAINNLVAGIDALFAPTSESQPLE